MAFNQISRRGLIKTAAATGALSALGAPLLAQSGPIRVGLVTPKTGPLSLFAQADEFTLSGLQAQLAEGIMVDGVKRSVEVVVKDSQSNPNRAAEVANELILNDEISLMLVSSVPETVNPVSDVCELNGVPCISTVAPWQAFTFGRGSSPEQGFESTFHFFWGFEALIPVMAEMWNSVSNNKQVAGLYPNDVDGRAWGDPEIGSPAMLKGAGFDVTPSGFFTPLNDDFSSIISKFKDAECEILTGNPIPPDFTTFWTQARQQGYQPKIATIAKAILFPAALDSLGDAGHNLSAEIWWSPNHPFASSLTGASAGQLAADFTATTGAQWTQPIGFAHALFEVGAHVLNKAGGTDPEALIAAIRDTQVDTVVGKVDWKTSPIANVAATPLVGGQWRKSDGDFNYDLVITTNPGAEDIPKGGEFEELTY